MKKILIFTIIISFLFTCQPKKEINVDKDIPVCGIDTINRLLLNIENELDFRLKSYTDSLLASIAFSNKRNKVSINSVCPEFEKLKESLINKDTILYFDIVNRQIDGAEVNHVSYSFYMAEINNYLPAYEDVCSNLASINRKRQKLHEGNKIASNLNFNYITKQEQDLVILCLIRSYLKGNTHSALMLSLYFEKGIYYFPKNIEFSKILEDIFYQKE